MFRYRLLALALGLLGSPALAEGARFAVHPLEVRELTVEQREKLQARFVVMLARVPDIRLAGDLRIDEALAKHEGKDCATRDACLQFLALATESLYGVFVRIGPDPLGTQLLVTARVVRSDGVLVRRVSIAAPIAQGIVEAGGELLAQSVEQLKLNSLGDTVRVGSLLPQRPEFEGSGLPPDGSQRRPVGYTLLGVGAATLVAGSILAGIAAEGRSHLALDPNGAVRPDQVGDASRLTNQSETATVLIPIGAAVAITGALLGFWPSSSGHGVGISLRAATTGAGVLIGGELP